MTALGLTLLPLPLSCAAMMRRHSSLTLLIEAHCGLEPDEEFARHFTQRRAMAVRHAMERIASSIDEPEGTTPLPGGTTSGGEPV